VSFAPGAPGQTVVVLAPPDFRAKRPREIAFSAPPIEPKRRYGNAGAAFTLGIGGAIRFRSDSGYRQLHASKHQNELDVFASYDVFQPVKRIVLAAGVSYRHASFGNDSEVSIATDAVQADLIARYTLARFLFPQIRAGVGAQLSRVRLEDGAVFHARDRSAGVGGSIGGGLLLQTPRRLFETRRGRLGSLVIGLLVEGGYVFAGAANYRLKVKSDSDLNSTRIALGKLELGGPYLRIAGVVRF
jgi:hypothetical protein